MIVEQPSLTQYERPLYHMKAPNFNFQVIIFSLSSVLTYQHNVDKNVLFCFFECYSIMQQYKVDMERVQENHKMGKIQKIKN